MMNTVFALALLTMSGNAVAFQQPVTAEEAAEAGAAAGEQAEAGQEGEAVEANADTDAQENYREAARAYSKCRVKARQDGGVSAMASACRTQRTRMLAAKEALKDAN